MQNRSCGRCNAGIEDGFFCGPCRSSLSRLGIGATPAAGLPMVSTLRPGTHANGDKPKKPRGSGCWQELVLFDRGFSVAVQTNDPTLLLQLLSTAVNGGDLLCPCGGDHRYSIEAHAGMRGAWYLLRAGARRLGVATTRAEALIRLRSHLHWKITQAATGGVLVHAGVVAWKGRALVLPGPSFTGKTSLVVELLRHGAIYVSDEYAIFDSAGMIHAFPSSLHIRLSEGNFWRALSAGRMGDTSAASTLRTGVVLFTAYATGAKWQPRRLTPGQALLGLVRNSVSPRQSPIASFQALRHAAAAATAFETRRGEARAAVPQILRLLEESGNAPRLSAENNF
jgi:hypothetical protein